MERRNFIGVISGWAGLYLSEFKLTNIFFKNNVENVKKTLAFDYMVAMEVIGAIESYVSSMKETNRSNANQREILKNLGIIIEQNNVIIGHIKEISIKIDFIKNYLEYQVPSNILSVFINNDIEAESLTYNSNLEILKSLSNNGSRSIRSVLNRNDELRNRIKSNLTETRNLRQRVISQNFTYLQMIPISKTFEIEKTLNKILETERAIFRQDLDEYLAFLDFAIDNNSVGMVKVHKALFEQLKNYPTESLPAIKFNEYGYRSESQGPIPFGWERVIKRINPPGYDRLIELGYITEQHRLFDLEFNEIEWNHRLLFGTPPPESLDTYGLCNRTHGPECSNVKYTLEKRLHNYANEGLPVHRRVNENFNNELSRLYYISNMIELSKDIRNQCNELLAN